MAVPKREYSVYREGVLVLHIVSGKGSFRRAGYKGKDTICEVPFADMLSYQAQEETLIQSVLAKAKGLDDLLFKLKLEGFELRDGGPKFDLPYRRW